MFFKKFDLLSPPITLYFKGEPIHSSIFSGILTLISNLITFSIGIYYTVLYIYKSNPNIYYYTKNIEDAGFFPFNSSSIFHFIQLGNSKNWETQDIDFDSIRIFGYEYPVEVYLAYNNLSLFNHWLYESCNKNDINNNLSEVITSNFPEKSACIRYYYDTKAQKYYNLSEKNFKWPALHHGISNKNNTNYGIIIEKCQNDSLKNNCKPEIEINKFIQNSFVILSFIDYYVELSNYKNPYVQYLYRLTSGFLNDFFTSNNLYFNPSTIIDKKGAFIDFSYSHNTYQLEKNEKITYKNNDDTNIIISYNFWMQNFLLQYERNYERFQDLISSIGGINSFLTIIFSIINSFVVNYRILLDTEELVLNSDKQNFRKGNINQIPTIFKKASAILNPPKINKKFNKNNTINYKQQNSVFQILLKDRTDILKINKKNFDTKSEPFKLIDFKKKNKINLSNKMTNKSLNNNISNMNNNYYIIKNNSNKSDINSKNMSISMSSINNNESIKKFEKIDKEEKYKPITKQNFSWCNYFYYVLSCKSKNQKITYYQTFRKEVISEENLIQNHINIFKLLKVCNIKNLDPFKLKNNNTGIC